MTVRTLLLPINTVNIPRCRKAAIHPRLQDMLCGGMDCNTTCGAVRTPGFQHLCSHTILSLHRQPFENVPDSPFHTKTLLLSANIHLPSGDVKPSHYYVSDSNVDRLWSNSSMGVTLDVREGGFPFRVLLWDV